MTRRIPSHPVLAAMLALALLVSFGGPASAAPYVTVGAGDSVVVTESIAAIDGPGHHFGFSQASVLAQATAVTASKADTPDPVAAGSNVTYSIVVTNVTGAQVTNVTVTDTLPAGLTLTATPTTNLGTCTGAAGATSFTCTIATLAAGQTVTITATALVPAGTANGTVITNTASVTFTDPAGVLQTVAPAPTAQTTVTTAPQLVTITKTDSPDPVNVGSPLTYTITVSNTGTGAVQNVVVSDTLPSGVNLVSATITGGTGGGTCTGTAPTLTCNIGTLNQGQTATITIVVTPVGGPFGGQFGGGQFGPGFGGQFVGPGFGGQFVGQINPQTGAQTGGACQPTLTNTASLTATGVVALTATTTTAVNCPPFPPFPPLPLLPPPPLEFLPPPPPPLLPPPPPAPMGAAAPRTPFPEVPVIPEADSLFLLVGGLVALGGLVGYRKLRRRDDA